MYGAVRTRSIGRCSWGAPNKARAPTPALPPRWPSAHIPPYQPQPDPLPSTRLPARSPCRAPTPRPLPPPRPPTPLPPHHTTGIPSPPPPSPPSVKLNKKNGAGRRGRPRCHHCHPCGRRCRRCRYRWAATVSTCPRGGGGGGARPPPPAAPAVALLPGVRPRRKRRRRPILDCCRRSPPPGSRPPSCRWFGVGPHTTPRGKASGGGGGRRRRVASLVRPNLPPLPIPHLSNLRLHRELVSAQVPLSPRCARSVARGAFRPARLRPARVQRPAAAAAACCFPLHPAPPPPRLRGCIPSPWQWLLAYFGEAVPSSVGGSPPRWCGGARARVWGAASE